MNRYRKARENRGNKIRRKFCCSILLALGMVSIGGIGAGCGSSKEKNTEKQEKDTIQLSLWGATEDQEMLQKMVESFQKKYASEADIQVTISEESEMNCKDTVLFSPKDAADVYTFAGDQFRALMQAGTLLEVTEDTDAVIDAIGGKDMAAYEAASWDGKLYAYPATSSNGYFLFYNSDYFSKEDVKSMDKILEIAAKNNKKAAMDFASGWYTYSFFKGAGLDVRIKDDGVTNECNWNQSAGDYSGAEVAQAMQDIASNDGFISCDDDAFKSGMQDGSIIAGVSGTWDAEAVEKAFGDGYAAAKLPTYTLAGDQVQMHSFTGYKMLGVSAYTKEPVWAQRLAEWITNEENQRLRFEMRAEAPTNVKVMQSKEVQESKAIAALSAQAPYAHIQDVAQTFWDPTYKFGTIMAAKNPEGKDLQALLDELVEGVTAQPEEK